MENYSEAGFQPENGNGHSFLFGLICGAALGALAGLLLAPKPGSELRNDVSDSARRLRRKGRQRQMHAFVHDPAPRQARRAFVQRHVVVRHPRRGEARLEGAAHGAAVEAEHLVQVRLRRRERCRVRGALRVARREEREQPARDALDVARALAGRIVDEQGAPPDNCLFAAAWKDDIEAAALFKSHGAAIDAVAHDATPFSAAFLWRKFAIAEWFLQNGADVDFADSGGRTVLYHAIRKRFSPAEIQVLVDAGADPGHEDNQDATPLQVAQRNRDHAIVKLLEGAQAAKP